MHYYFHFNHCAVNIAEVCLPRARGPAAGANDKHPLPAKRLLPSLQRSIPLLLKAKMDRIEDTITENDVSGTLQEKVKEPEAILKGLVQPPAVTPESTFANYVRGSLLTMSSLKFKKARASINKILTRLIDEDTEEEEGDLPTVSARCWSAPLPGITTTRQAQGDMFQPDPSQWHDKPPTGTP